MEQPKNNLKIVTDKKTNARVILPNMLTLIGVCIGLSSIRFALDGKFEFAVIAIILAAIIDGLDGRIARLIKGTSKVGKELDSLTDMISFGVAPAFIMYFWKLNTLGRFGWLLCLIYVICVALRLARFNVNTYSILQFRSQERRLDLLFLYFYFETFYDLNQFTIYLSSIMVCLRQSVEMCILRNKAVE